MKKKVVPKLRLEVEVKVDIVTSDDIKIYNTGKFQYFTARYIIKGHSPQLTHYHTMPHFDALKIYCSEKTL